LAEAEIIIETLNVKKMSINSCNNNRYYEGTINKPFIGILIDDSRYNGYRGLPYPIKPGNASNDCKVYLSDFKKQGGSTTNRPYLKDKFIYQSNWYWERSGGVLPPGLALVDNSSQQGTFYGKRSSGGYKNLLKKRYYDGQVGTILQGTPTSIGTWVSTFNLIQESVVGNPLRVYVCDGTQSQMQACLKTLNSNNSNQLQTQTEIVGTLSVTITISANPLGDLVFPNLFFSFDKLSTVSQNVPLIQKDCIVTGFNSSDFPPGLGIAFSTAAATSTIESLTIIGSPTQTGFFSSTITPCNSAGNGSTAPMYFKINEVGSFSSVSGSFAQNPSPFVSIYEITGYTTGASYSGVTGIKHDYLSNDNSRISLLGMTGRDPFFSVSANSFGDFFAVSSPCNYQSSQIKSANSNGSSGQISGFGRLKSFLLRKNGDNPLMPPSGIKIGGDLLSDFNNTFLGSDVSINSDGNFLVSSLYDNHGISAYVLKAPERLVSSDPSSLCINCGFLSSSTVEDDVPPPVGFGFGCNLYWNKKKSFPLPDVNFDYDSNESDVVPDFSSDQDMYLYADAIGEYDTILLDSHWCIDWFQMTDAISGGPGTGVQDGKYYIQNKQVSMIVSYREKSSTVNKLLPDGTTKPVFYVKKIVSIGNPTLVARLSSDLDTEKKNGKVAFLYDFNFDSLPFYKTFGGATFNFLKNVAAASAQTSTLQRSNIGASGFVFQGTENLTDIQILNNASGLLTGVDACDLCDVIKKLTNIDPAIPLSDRTTRIVESDYCSSGGSQNVCCNVPENYFWGSDALCPSEGEEINFVSNGIAKKVWFFVLKNIDETDLTKSYDPRAVFATVVVNGKTVQKDDGIRILSSNLSYDSKGTRAFVNEDDLSVGFLTGNGSF
jgi:hypothetical protein